MPFQATTAPEALRDADFIVVLCLTFKQDCLDLFDKLKSYGVDVKVHDPMADREEAKVCYGVELCDWEELSDLDLGAVILAVPHAWSRERGSKCFPGCWERMAVWWM